MKRTTAGGLAPAGLAALLATSALAAPAAAPPYERTADSVIVHPAHGAAVVRAQVISDRIARITAWPETGHPAADEPQGLAVIDLDAQPDAQVDYDGRTVTLHRKY